MDLQVFNIQGKPVRTIKVPDEIYGVEMNTAVLHTVVKAYRANRRQGTHATKTKAMVSGGGKKPFKQKGTGGARQGSTRNPHMPGGGENFGPQPRDYRLAVNKKVRQLNVIVAMRIFLLKTFHCFVVMQHFATHRLLLQFLLPQKNFR